MAYAAVVSLKHTIDPLLDPLESRILIPESERRFISEELDNLQSVLDTIRSSPSRKRTDALETRVKDEVYKFEDLINSHLSDQILLRSEGSIDESFTLVLSQGLLKVKNKIGSFAKRLNADDECSKKDKRRSHSFASRAVPWKNKMVGLDNELKELQDRILSGTTQVYTMSIVGMAGIGKTSFVKQVYYHPLVREHFRHRLFLQIGPQYRLRETLLLALNQLGVRYHKMDRDRLLGDCVHKSLLDGRYLIVLDDVWSAQVWDELECFFPNDNNGSRIILTSRLLDITVFDIFQMPFLNDDQSWNLLHELVFTTEELCTYQLAKIGKKIAKNCEGLPLAIIEVAKLLGKIEKTVEEWSIVAEKEDPFTITRDDNTPLSNALLLSYMMLPQYLKVCFLYMAVFPKKYEITRLKLFRLWISERIVERGRYKGYEEVADDLLYELISHNVVLVTQTGSVGTYKTSRLHFTFRNLCVNEAKREKAFHVIKKYTDTLLEDINSQQRLCTHNNIVLGFKQVHSWMESVPSARSLLCYGPQQQYPVGLYLRFRLLKILDALRIRFYGFPHQVLQLVLLRYLAFTYDGELPASISCLQNLEVLIVHRHQIIKFSDAPVYLPIEIWKLKQLIHLECLGLDLPDPSKGDSFILKKLSTLSGVSDHSFTRRILARMPNLLKLGIQIESISHDSVETFHFPGGVTNLDSRLESFRCIVANPCFWSPIVSSNLIFLAEHVRKLTLSGCGFSWEYMRKISSELQNLRILKLRKYAFRGHEWKTSGIFYHLRFLLLEDLDIQRWEAESNNFPVLERLIIRHCYKLREVPCTIGEFQRPLEMIEIDDCSVSLGISVRKILDERRGSGNNYLQVRIHSSKDDKKP